MSNIIVFPKRRMHSQVDYARARINQRQLSHGAMPPSARRDGLAPRTVEPIWKARTHGILMSVVIPTSGRPNLLQRCLAALANQTLDPSRWEIIIVDDDPTQATRDVVDQWRTRLGPLGPCLTYMACGEPHGPGPARNRGWAAARGALVAFTDDGAIPRRDWLEAGLRAFDGIAQAVSGRVEAPLAGLPTDNEREALALAEAEFTTANCFCQRRVLEELGGFDERFGDIVREDTDLYFRLLRANALVRRAADAVVDHPPQPAAWGASVIRQKAQQFDALLYKKHPALYREKIRPAHPWDYFLTVFLLLASIFCAALGERTLAAAAGAGWLLLSVNLCLRRLRGTVKSPSHIAEMLLTSFLIPPLAVFWRLLGAMRFRVGFA